MRKVSGTGQSKHHRQGVRISFANTFLHLHLVGLSVLTRSLSGFPEEVKKIPPFSMSTETRDTDRAREPMS